MRYLIGVACGIVFAAVAAFVWRTEWVRRLVVAFFYRDVGGFR